MTSVLFCQSSVSVISPSENTSLYVSYARGYRVGGINPSDNPEFVGFDPETSDNYELGIKGNLLRNRLQFALSGFVINRSNIQSSVFEPGTNGLRFATLSNGDGRNLGFDVDLAYLIVNGLQIRGNFGFLDAEYTRLEIPDVLAGSNRTLEEGRKVIQSPEFTLNLSLSYIRSFSVGNDYLTLSANVNFTTIGEQFYDFENTISQPTYSLLNTKVGASFKGVGLYFWTRNLTDERYLAFVPFTGSTAAFLGNPRTYGLTLSYNLN